MEGGKRKDGYLELKHKPGQVLILMFWNSWNPAGNKQMDSLQDMMTRNKAVWKDNVRMCSLSCDNSP